MTEFRTLNKKEKNEFRQWARDNYTAGEDINEIWHPITQEECCAINASAIKILRRLANACKDEKTPAAILCRETLVRVELRDAEARVRIPNAFRKRADTTRVKYGVRVKDASGIPGTITEFSSSDDTVYFVPDAGGSWRDIGDIKQL